MSLNTILATAPLTATGYHLKATGTTIGNSLIWDNGTNVGIGNTNTSYTLDVSGTGRFTSTLLVSGALTGAAATFSGTLTTNGSIQQNSSQDLGTSAYFSANVTNGFRVLNAANTVSLLSITNAGAATFSSSINSGAIQATASGAVIQLIGLASSNAYYVNDQTANSGKRWRFGHTGGAAGFSSWDVYNQTDSILALTLASTGAATFSSTLATASRGITVGSMPVGSVIQTVHYQFGTAFSTSSASDIDTGLNLSITPTSSTSKILIIITAYVRATQSSGNCYIYSRLWRGAVGGTSLINGFAAMGNFASTDIRGVDATSFLDSPATTSAVTYRYSLSSIYAATVYLNSNTNPSTITLMEIAQ
jgi:hypothetical protein